MLWQAPHAIDVRATSTVPVPPSWRDALPGQAEVSVLRLCEGRGPAMPGWCAAAPALQGPEIEVICGGINSKKPDYAAIWRQGNLLHFGFEPMPGEYNATGRKLLLNAIAYIARFTSDRPLVRERTFVDPEGSGPSPARLERLLGAAASASDLAACFDPPWSDTIAALESAAAQAFVVERRGALRAGGRRFTFDEDALALGIDVRQRGALRDLAGRTDPAEAERALRLLPRLVADGPGADTTLANWRHWLAAREAALFFDPLALVWRLDWLAHWRGVPSAELRGAARADGDAVRDPAAAALAAQVVAFHGGARALDDLQTFACRTGEVRCLWDRRAGVFRRENAGPLPAGNLGTAWKVVVFDTAADADLIEGGGPPPRPRVSGRSAFRELIERLFLPLLLLEPGTALRLLPDDEDGRACLEVRLAGRCLDPKQAYVLHVDRKTGALRALDLLTRTSARPEPVAVRWHVEATAAVGPLNLPVAFVREGRGTQRIEFAEPEWNPTVPDGIATETGFVLGGR